MIFNSLLEDDEDDERGASPEPPALPTAFDVLPVLLMEDGATQEQIDLIKGRKGSLCVVVEVPAAEWVSPVAALMRRLGEWDKMAVEDVDRIARNEEVMLVIGAKLVEGGIELWDREGPVSFEKFIKRGLEASHVWRLIVQHIDHIELDLDLRDVRGLPLRDALHV